MIQTEEKNFNFMDAMSILQMLLEEEENAVQKYGLRLAKWQPDVRIHLQLPDKNSKMTAKYFYVESRFGRVPWMPTQMELLTEDTWNIVVYHEDSMSWKIMTFDGEVDETILKEEHVCQCGCHHEETTKDLMHEVWDLQKQYDERIMKDRGIHRYSNENMSMRYLAMAREMFEVMGEIEPYKYWKENKKEITEEECKENARKEYVDFMHFFFSCAQDLFDTPEQMVEYYKRKNKVNHERQDNHY